MGKYYSGSNCNSSMNSASSVQPQMIGQDYTNTTGTGNMVSSGGGGSANYNNNYCETGNGNNGGGKMPTNRNKSTRGGGKGRGNGRNGNGQFQQAAKTRKNGAAAVTLIGNGSGGTGNQGLGVNSREKEKTQSVNTAFTSLRTLIPTEPADRKLSKIETLRLATSYISHLSSQLHLTDLPCSQGLNEFGHSPSDPNSEHQTKICTFCLSESKKLRTSMTNNNNVPNSINSMCVPLRIDYGPEGQDELFPLPLGLDSLNAQHDGLSYYY